MVALEKASENKNVILVQLNDCRFYVGKAWAHVFDLQDLPLPFVLVVSLD